MGDTFEEWYRRNYHHVVSSLAALSGDADLAQEAADEAFVRALSRWERVEAMSSPAGWVYRVALNVLRRTLRRRALEARLFRRQLPEEAVAVASHPEVWAAVRSLPERQRHAIVLRFVADLPEADVAAAMGVRRGTVASTLAVARARLAEILAPEVKT